MFIINSHVSVIFFSKNYRAKPGRSASTYIKESLNILKFLRNKTLKTLQLKLNGSAQIHMTVPQVSVCNDLVYNPILLIFSKNA